ncbi:hypothetical protein HDE_02428 [Halotydeus destructor]|nr:hypothetical protein HDE_02428 [Halotydeus destructor]
MNCAQKRSATNDGASTSLQDHRSPIKLKLSAVIRDATYLVVECSSPPLSTDAKLLQDMVGSVSRKFELAIRFVANKDEKTDILKQEVLILENENSKLTEKTEKLTEDNCSLADKLDIVTNVLCHRS